MTEKDPTGFSPPDSISGDRFVDAQIDWIRNDLRREQASEDFANTVDAFFDNNPQSRFIDIIRVDHASFAQPKQETWEKLVSLRQQQLPQWLFKQREARLKNELAKIYSDDSPPPTPIYYEHLWFSQGDSEIFLVERVFEGDEVGNWIIPPDKELWVPPQTASVSETRTVIRYTTKDDKDRYVPPERQHKLFYVKRGNERVVVSEHLELPNPDDYGTNKVAQFLLRQATDVVLTHPGRDEFEAGHQAIDDLIKEDLPSSEVYISKLPGGIPVLDSTVYYYKPVTQNSSTEPRDPIN